KNTKSGRPLWSYPTNPLILCIYRGLTALPQLHRDRNQVIHDLFLLLVSQLRFLSKKSTGSFDDFPDSAVAEFVENSIGNHLVKGDMPGKTIWNRLLGLVQSSPNTFPHFFHACIVGKHR